MRHEQRVLEARAAPEHWWFRARAHILRRIAANIAPPSADVAVLDFGCGSGANYTAFRDYAYLGADPSDQAIDQARQSHPDGTFVRCDTMHDPRLDAPRASIVLAADVLEHIEDDSWALRELVDSTSRGCHILVTVPAEPALWSPHDVALGHFRRYDRDTFTMLWNGLPVVPRLVSAFNCRLYPLIRIARSVTRWRGRALGPTRTDVSMPRSRLANRLLESIFLGEADRLVAAFRGEARPYRRGVSMLAVLRNARTDTP